MGQAQQEREYEGELVSPLSPGGKDENEYRRQAIELNLVLMRLSPDTLWDVSRRYGCDLTYVPSDQFRVHAKTHRRGLDEIITLTQWIPRSAVQDDRYDVALVLVGELEKLVRGKLDV